ncbi:MAG: aspartate/glutamate racemase family protein [Ectothiorhodospiraceae bacterium]|nr:aspartate/glutamate racemase family protein [Ectothiorhodospiraceae bacterium]
MRILLVNPNITHSITETMVAEARRTASPGTEIVPATAAFGTLYVENRVEASIAAHAVLEAVAEHAGDCDAVIVCAFGDPGLLAARELLDVPVVGIAESAMLLAHTLGRRYSIVCMTSRLRTWYLECAQSYGLHTRLAAVRALDTPVDVTRARETLAEPLLALCERTIAEDDAEVVVLGGGPLAGIARDIADRIPVPTLDGVSCAVQMAESLVRLAPRPPRVGSHARPRPKPARGLSPALATAMRTTAL